VGSSRQAVLFVVCLVAISIMILAVIGARIGASWSTFVPDLIVGVATAGGIASLVALIQSRSDARRTREEKITSAYENLLDAVAEVQLMNLRQGSAAHLSKVGIRMLNLAELVDSETPEIVDWFEAERQMMAYKVVTSATAVEKVFVTGGDALEQELAAAPFRQWTAEFVFNVRAWRNSRVTGAEMGRQAALIEKGLREKGFWRDEPLPWRSDIPNA
jgi:hypothetical protein